MFLGWWMLHSLGVIEEQEFLMSLQLLVILHVRDLETIDHFGVPLHVPLSLFSGVA